MDNIILIGMQGCGKSTIGVVLAKKLGYRFIDSDLLIQEKYENTLENLIEEYGDKGFIELENEVNKSINTKRTVIATGGSAVYGAEAMEHFADIGTVIYLDVEQDELKERLGSLKSRGVVSNGKTTVEEIYEDRKALYKKYADITIALKNRLLRESVEELYELIVNKDNCY
ncbi:MAG: shikimate kinase [Lachnospira sp.]|nr:shikimate kinase [Lachnospira sp.]